MSTQTPRTNGAQQPDGEQYARADALAQVARELDQLRQRLDTLTATGERVDDLARSVADLADTVTHALTPTATDRPKPTPAPSWLIAPADPDAIAGVLQDLCGWLYRVYLRYSDASLPECWLWHPDVVEELLWLRSAWSSAYEGQTASVQAAGDWHDRQRPGVVHRIKSYAGSCSRERHQTRPGWSTRPQPATPVPGVDTWTSIVGWWATARDQAAPEPPPAAPTGASW